MSLQTCEHGRPTTGGTWWRSTSACEDCENADWEHARHATVLGLLVIVTLIVFVPLCMLLAGVFW